VSDLDRPSRPAASRNVLDRVISYISPEAGARRARFRFLEETLLTEKRKYEGGTRGHRGANWFASSNSPAAEIGGPLSILRNRSRDLVRNNPYAERGVRFLTAVTVGTGIIPNSTHPDENKRKKIESWWKEFGETTACDAARKLDAYGLQALGFRGAVEAGEGLARKVITRDKKWPIKWQAIESDHIATDRIEELGDGRRIIHGVQVDENGAVEGLWLYSRHPGDGIWGKTDSFFVPEKDLSHTFRLDRAGQVRGVPWLAPVMLRLRDLDEYQDAQLVRQKIAACWVGFVRDIQEPDDNPGAAGIAVKAQKKIEPTPGMFEHLGPGKDVVFSNPPGVQNFGEVTTVSIQAIATGLGVTAESITQDLSRVNFSGGRMGKIDMDRQVKQYQWHMLVPQVCDRMWEWFNQNLLITGRITEADVYPATWTPPRRELVDPTREIPAMANAVKAGFTSRQAVIRELGDDPKQIYAEVAEDNKAADELELVFDTDLRRHLQNIPDNQNTDPTDVEGEEEDDAKSSDSGKKADAD
jgi:lambda family phage portal protein